MQTHIGNKRMECRMGHISNGVKALCVFIIRTTYTLDFKHQCEIVFLCCRFDETADDAMCAEAFEPTAKVLIHGRINLAFAKQQQIFLSRFFLVFYRDGMVEQNGQKRESKRDYERK